jgi:hypothetical protein
MSSPAIFVDKPLPPPPAAVVTFPASSEVIIDAWVACSATTTNGLIVLRDCVALKDVLEHYPSARLQSVDVSVALTGATSSVYVALASGIAGNSANIAHIMTSGCFAMVTGNNMLPGASGLSLTPHQNMDPELVSPCLTGKPVQLAYLLTGSATEGVLFRFRVAVGGVPHHVISLA